MGVMFNMDTDTYLFLKSTAAEQGVSMAAVLRTVVEAFQENPKPVLCTADRRARGEWWAVVRVWQSGDWLRHTVYEKIPSTAELPALAARACIAAEAPHDGVADRVRSELPIFRQNLARQDSATLRVENADEEWLLQISVFRELPEEYSEYFEPAEPVSIRR